MRSTRTIMAIAFSVALTACTAPSIHSGGKGLYPERNEVPVASNFQTSAQLKLQAAEHWRRVAYDSAEGLIKSIRSGGACLPKSTCVSLYLRRNCETTACRPRTCDTTFNQVFFNELLTALVDLGYEVSTTPTANAAVVDIDVQAIRFAANRPQYRYAGRPVEIGPGLWALEDATSLLDIQGNAAPRTTGFDANWFRTEFASGATPRNELVITVSAISPQRTYLARNTKVYYTSDADSAHYFCGATQDDAARPSATTRAIPVIGDCSTGRCTDSSGRRQ